MTNTTIDLGFAPRPRGRIDDLVALWQRARMAAENAPACPCHGIVPGRIDPDVIEENMLAALRTRYRAGGQSELVALLDRRLRKSPFAGMRESFEAWLRGLPVAALGDTAQTALYDDLESTLRYYAQAQPQFACS